METKEEALSQFSEDTLNEMKGESIEGGKLVEPNLKCSGPYVPNSETNCGIPKPPPDDIKST